MTHLYIEQNTGLTEEVNSSIISKLYELAINGDLDETSDLKGRLHSEYAHRFQAEQLNATYPDLHISIDNYAIPFEDPNMIAYLNSIGVGSNGMITEAQAAAATVVANSVNTTVTKFNELKYFTNITTSKNGYTGYSTGACRFYNWTALEEVDISNFTSIGHDGSSGYEDTFYNCTSLRKVTASDKLTQIGVNAFKGCANLEYIIGLSGNIELSKAAFSGCSKLKQSNFDAVYYTQEEADAYNTEHNLSQESEDFKTTSSVKIPGVTFLLTDSDVFSSCNLLTSIQLSQSQTEIPQNSFYECKALTTVTGLNNVTTINIEAFLNCSQLTTLDIDWSKITTIKNNAFSNCSNLTINNLAMPNLTLIKSGAFNGTNVKTISDLGSITEVTGFVNCKSLTSVVLPNTCTTIESSCFYGSTALANINIPNSLKYIKFRGLAKTAITSIVLPEGFLCAGESAFAENSNLTSLTFPSTLTQQWENGENFVSSNTGLKYLDINAGSGLQTVTIPSNLDIESIYIGSSKNASFTVPDSVIYISSQIRDGSTGIITFGNNSNVKYMGQNECYNKIKSFDFTTTHTIEEWDQLEHTSNNQVYDNLFQKAFANFPKNNFKYIPCQFQRNNVSRNDIPDIIGDNVIGIGREAFSVNNNTNLNYSITLPSTLQYIGKAAFGRIRPTAFIFKSTTPPMVNCTTYTDEIFYQYRENYSQTSIDNDFSTIPIYVPSTAVAAYQSAFPRLASYIQANPNE